MLSRRQEYHIWFLHKQRNYFHQCALLQSPYVVLLAQTYYKCYWVLEGSVYKAKAKNDVYKLSITTFCNIVSSASFLVPTQSICTEKIVELEVKNLSKVHGCSYYFGSNTTTRLFAIFFLSLLFHEIYVKITDPPQRKNNNKTTNIQIFWIHKLPPRAKQ